MAVLITPESSSLASFVLKTIFSVNPSPFKNLPSHIEMNGTDCGPSCTWVEKFKPCSRVSGRKEAGSTKNRKTLSIFAEQNC